MATIQQVGSKGVYVNPESSKEAVAMRVVQKQQDAAAPAGGTTLQGSLSMMGVGI